MWTDHTEYDEYQKPQLSTVVRYQQNIVQLSKKSPKILRYLFFFLYRTPLFAVTFHGANGASITCSPYCISYLIAFNKKK